MKLKHGLTKLLILLLAILSGILILVYSPGTAYLYKAAFIAVSFYSVYFSIRYSFVKEGGLLRFYQSNRPQIWLTAIGFITFFPLLTESFYYYDEYWAFSGGPLTEDVTLLFGRAVQSLLSILFGFLNPGNMYYGRWFTVFCAVLLAMLLYAWMYKKSDNKILSFLISAFICFSSVMADCVSYVVINSFIYGIILTTLSVIFFEMGRNCFEFSEKKFTGIMYWVICVIWIYFAIHSYQLAVPFFLVMFAIEVWFCEDRKSVLTNFFGYIACLIPAGIGYAVSLKLGAQAGGSARAVPVSSVEEILQKIIWFLTDIIPAAFNRMIAAVFGRGLFVNKNYWSYMNYRDSMAPARIILYGVMAILCIGAWLFYYKRNRKVLEMLFLILAIPGSYVVYLLLKENGYHTYYAFALISLFALYLCLGVYEIFANLRKKELAYGLLGVILTVCLLQANIYVRQFWIHENKAPMEQIRREIDLASANGRDLYWIHVYGTPNPGQLNTYSKAAVRNELRMRGLQPENFKITCSDQYHFSSSYEETDMQTARENLTPEEWDMFSSFYPQSGEFYLLNMDGKSENQETLLYELSMKARLLPSPETDFLKIDLKWISPVWEKGDKGI